MEPGRGYMYKSNNSQTVTFNYPSVSAMLRSAQALRRTPAFEPHWETDIFSFANTMTVTASVFMNGEEIRDGSFEIAAFSGDNCRGNAMLEYVEGFESPMSFLMIFGDENEPITLRVYDHATGTEYVADERFNFQTNAIYGIPDETYPVSINNLTGIEPAGVNKISLYPNPTEKLLYINHQRNTLDMLSVMDVSGRVVLIEKELKAKYIDVSSLVPGIYFLKIMDENQTFVYQFSKK